MNDQFFEIELAAELLSVSDEQELDQFLGRIMGDAGGRPDTPAGRKLRELLRKTTRRALPGGQAGARLFGLETEGLSPEDRELSVARGIVRLAGDAARKLAAAGDARSALLAAARRHAPGLASHMTNGNPRSGSGGRWFRRDVNRTTRKGEEAMHDLDRTLRSQEPETEADFEAAIFGEAESEFEEETYEISEEQEIDLAAELLAVSDDRELDQFLGGLLKKARGAIGPLMKKYLKPLAKKVLPIAGKAVGGFFGGPVGAGIGGKLGSFATTLFEVDFESMDSEAQDMEVARSFVRFANAAASNAAAAPRTADPNTAAKNAIIRAAKVHAPGLLRKGAGGGAVSNGSSGSSANSGKWIRRNNRIVLLGV